LDVTALIKAMPDDMIGAELWQAFYTLFAGAAPAAETMP